MLILNALLVNGKIDIIDAITLIADQDEQHEGDLRDFIIGYIKPTEIRDNGVEFFSHESVVTELVPLCMQSFRIIQGYVVDGGVNLNHGTGLPPALYD